MYPIPPNATRIRYIEAVGPSGTSAVDLSTPGIDTGIVPSTKARIEIDWMPIRTGTISAAEPMAGGVAGFTPTGKTGSNTRFACGMSSTGPSLYWGISNSNIYGSVSWSSGTRVKQFIQMDGTSATYGYGSTTFTATINPYENTTKTIALFGRNGNSDNVFHLQAQPQQTTRIYSCKIWQDHTSELSRDFVPVRVGTVCYLFDRVSGTLFGNAVTGSFVPGPDTFQQGVVPTRMMVGGVRVRKKGLIPAEFTEVEYIQNTGSATSTDSDYSWVDTGITPKSDTIIESRHVLISAINYYPGFYGSASYSTPYRRMSLGASWGHNNTSNQFKPYIRRGNASRDAVSTAKISNNWARYVFDGATCTAYDDGGNVISTMTSSTAIDCLYPMQIFRDGIVQNGSLRLGSGFGISRCSFFRMSRNGEYQINLVPVRRGTEAGFYDLVSKTFFGSANQNAQLVAGPDK